MAVRDRSSTYFSAIRDTAREQRNREFSRTGSSVDDRLASRRTVHLGSARHNTAFNCSAGAYSTHDATDLMGQSVTGWIDSTRVPAYMALSFYEPRTEMKGKEAPLTSRESSWNYRSTRSNDRRVKRGKETRSIAGDRGGGSKAGTGEWAGTGERVKREAAGGKLLNSPAEYEATICFAK